MTFWIYPYLYPIESDPKYQHWFCLGICIWLNTIGPNAFVKIYEFFDPDYIDENQDENEDEIKVK